VLAINDTEEELTYEQVMSIGKGSTYDKRRELEETIRDFAEETQRHFHQRIVDMDSNRDSPTFNGGFDAVVRLRMHFRQNAHDWKMMTLSSKNNP
jgi:hypothetical protein